MKRILAIAAVLSLLLVGGLVWPTPYEHYKSGPVNLRVNRITGKTERLTVAGWRVPVLPANADPVAEYFRASGDNEKLAARLEDIKAGRAVENATSR